MVSFKYKIIHLNLDIFQDYSPLWWVGGVELMVLLYSQFNQGTHVVRQLFAFFGCDSSSAPL